MVRMKDRAHTLTAILPCNDVAKSRAFYERLGFTVRGGDEHYLLLADGKGAELHLTPSVEDWLVPGRNPFGLYLYTDDVDALASRFPGEILGPAKRPEHKPWGMYEFALSDPDETLVRIGWPSVTEVVQAIPSC
jgi:catechol 2,3-dioxygenase-like lactoylglutathione lyase family enzyme